MATTKHYAAIDIGSNAVRLMIKRLEDEAAGLFSTAVRMRVPLRLGQDVFTKGKIGKRKTTNLVELMKAFKIVTNIYEVKPCHFRACATQSLREAKNSEEVVKMIKEATGITVEVISGEEEASIFCNSHLKDDPRTLVFVDVGGGSTEVSMVSHGKVVCQRSFAVGTVKLLNGLCESNWGDKLAYEIKQLAYEFSTKHPEGFHGATMVGAGGNINKIFDIATDRDAEERVLSVRSLTDIYLQMRSLGIAQRIKTYKMKADRADVIIPASEIFLTIANTLSVTEIEIPSEGLSDGIIYKLYAKDFRNKAHIR